MGYKSFRNVLKLAFFLKHVAKVVLTGALLTETKLRKTVVILSQF